MKVTDLLFESETSMIGRIKEWLKSRRNAKITKVWDEKSDKSIMDAYEDAMGWLNLPKGSQGIPLPKSLADSLKMRLEQYILPQMEKRGLQRKTFGVSRGN